MDYNVQVTNASADPLFRRALCKRVRGTALVIAGIPFSRIRKCHQAYAVCIVSRTPVNSVTGVPVAVMEGM